MLKVIKVVVMNVGQIIPMEWMLKHLKLKFLVSVVQKLGVCLFADVIEVMWEMMSSFSHVNVHRLQAIYLNKGRKSSSFSGFFARNKNCVIYLGHFKVFENQLNLSA